MVSFKITLDAMGKVQYLGNIDIDYVIVIMIKRAAKELLCGDDFVHPSERYKVEAKIPGLHNKLLIENEEDLEFVWELSAVDMTNEVTFEVSTLALDVREPTPEPLSLSNEPFKWPVEKNDTVSVNADDENVNVMPESVHVDVDADTPAADVNVDVDTNVDLNVDANPVIVDITDDDVGVNADVEGESEGEGEDDGDVEGGNDGENSETEDDGQGDEVYTEGEGDGDGERVHEDRGDVDKLISDYESGDGSEVGFCTSSDEEETVVSRLASQMNRESFQEGPDGKIMLKKGLIFDSVTHFREVVVDYSVQEGFILKRGKNEKYGVNFSCKWTGCPWECKGAVAPDKIIFEIRKYYGVHTCQRQNRIPDANANWMAKKIEAVVREYPEITPKLIQEHFRRVYGLDTTMPQVWSCRSKALDALEEDYKKSYAKLYSYCMILLKRNLGSGCVVKCIPPTPTSPPVFHRLFISLACQKNGYLRGCTPFIGLDGCHLKGTYGGILLTAVAMDANSGIFPVAVAVVESENLNSWKWFLWQLKEHISEENRPVTFMSDRQKGLISAVKSTWPQAHHRFCARHIFNNLKKSCSSILFRTYYWRTVRTSDEIKYNVTMWKMFECQTRGYWLLNDNEVEHRSRHKFDTTSKSDHVTNNFTESFNSWLGDSRAKPIVTMMETIRTRLMQRMRERRELASRWEGDIPPNVGRKLNKLRVEARKFTCLWAHDKEFEIAKGTEKWEVDLRKGHCLCNMWQVSGLPCYHAMAAIITCRDNVNDYVDPYLKKEAYLMTYSNLMHPIPDERNWPEVDCWVPHPPVQKRQPGRPRKGDRVREPGEDPAPSKRRPQQCSNCKQLGHNKAKCPLLAPRTSSQMRIEGTDATVRRRNEAAVGRRDAAAACWSITSVECHTYIRSRPVHHDVLFDWVIAHMTVFD